MEDVGNARKMYLNKKKHVFYYKVPLTRGLCSTSAARHMQITLMHDPAGTPVLFQGC